MAKPATTKAKSEPVNEDHEERELEHQVHRQLRDNLVELCGIHARTLEYANVMSVAHRSSLELIEFYRWEKIQAMRQLAEMIKGNNSPDGVIKWDSEKGYHYAED